MFKIKNRFCSLLVFLSICSSLPAGAATQNMHLIDSGSNGFEIYRSGSPTTENIREWCKLGIQEVYVLSGDAATHELKDISACPGLKIIYNLTQKAKTPLTTEFLAQFDNWVKDAQSNGKKILFRCSCGCHRTGRLAAYYRMKYNHWSPSDAYAELRALAKWMLFFPFLDNQVWALNDYATNKTCGEKWKYCVWSEKTGQVATPTDTMDEDSFAPEEAEGAPQESLTLL